MLVKIYMLELLGVKIIQQVRNFLLKIYGQHLK